MSEREPGFLRKDERPITVVGLKTKRAIVMTPHGVITEVRVAWQSRTTGRDVFTWRTDGQMPYEFLSKESAQKWVDHVWADDPREKAHCGWKVVER